MAPEQHLPNKVVEAIAGDQVSATPVVALHCEAADQVPVLASAMHGHAAHALAQLPQALTAV